MEFHVESQHLHFSSEKEEREAAPLPHYSNSSFFFIIHCSHHLFSHWLKAYS